MLLLILVLTSVSVIIEGKPSTEYANAVPLLRHGSKSYHVASNYKTNFLQALRYCNHINMSLLTIESEEENDIVYKYIRDADAGKEYWSSGTRLLDGTTWIWLSNGNAVDYTNWDNGEPNNKHEQCINLKINERNKLYWNDAMCNNELPFICERVESNDNNKENKSFWSRILYSSSNVNANIVNSKNKTFYFSSEFKGTFWKSLQFCHAIGMKPVAIENEAENKKVYKYIRDTNAAQIWWTAGTRILDDTTWFWLSSGNKIEYTNWDSPEPNNVNTNERCLLLMLNKNKNDIVFNDSTCNAEFPVICEIPLEANIRRYQRSVPVWFERAAAVQARKNVFGLNTTKGGNNPYHFESTFQGDQKQATEFCNYLGMDLVEITSADENKYIVDTLELLDRNAPFWTSGIKSSTGWVWHKTEEPLKFSNWKIGGSNLNRNLNCLLIDSNGKWLESSCSDLHSFICEERSVVTENPPLIDPVEDEENEDCKQPVINVYINNNQPVQGEQNFSPIVIDDQSVGEEKSYRLKNNWNSCNR